MQPKQFYTPEEDAIIREIYPAYGAVEVQRKFLSHRAVGSINSRAKTLGVERLAPREPKRFFTLEEDVIIREQYPTRSAREIHEQFLPNRTVGTIQARARALGIQKVREEQSPIGDILEEEPLIEAQDYKKCVHCHLFKKRNKYFQRDVTRPDGLGVYCKHCLAPILRNRRRKRRSKVKEVLEEGVKRCTICKGIKSLEEFYKNPTARDGRWPRCKACEAQRRDPALHNMQVKLRGYINFTVEDYKAMLNKQNGLCAICGKPETTMERGKVRALAIDHCHVTDAVRGLLCQKCNQALGLLGEDPDRVKALLRYIEERCLW